MTIARRMAGAAFLAVALTGCAATPNSSIAGLQELPDVALRGGDLVIALADRLDAPPAIVRYRGEADEALGLRVHGRVLVEDLRATDVAGSASGRWLAARTAGRDLETTVVVWDLHRARLPLHLSDSVWTSPVGCAAPRFHPSDAVLALDCPALERKPGHITPAHLVLVRLPELVPVGLVGERDRIAPALGVDGDLYWIENRGGVSTVVRRGDDDQAFVVHESTSPMTELWPQYDGSIVAAVVAPGGDRELRRFEASGASSRVPTPRDMGRILGPGQPLAVAADGEFVFASCTPQPCTVSREGPSGVGSAPLPLTGTPLALASVPRFGVAAPHVEDLATAPATVFTTHDASNVSVLGIELGMPLEAAFATLDRGRRFPQWLAFGGGIGVGAVRSGHCVEFLGDAGLVDSIELSGCARSYLSPALQPLLNREAMADGALPLIRRFLGAGVSAQVGDPAVQSADPAIEGTTVRFTVVERGYSFEARTEILKTSRARLMNGRLRLRLQLPDRRAVGRR